MFVLKFATVVAALLAMVAHAHAVDPKLSRAWALPFLALGLYGLTVFMLLVCLGVLL